MLAQDQFLPPFFANRDRRLVFSSGIIILAILSAILLIVFGGVTDKLIPLFAVGAFGALLFSQAGMVVHWLRRPGRGVRTKLFYNGLGAVTTAVALTIIVLAKFREGGWITILIVPGLVLFLNRIRHHYQSVAEEVEEPLDFLAAKPRPPSVVIPIDAWNRATEQALQFGMLFSDDIMALHIGTETDDEKQLRELWEEKVRKPAERAGGTVPPSN